MAKIFPIIKKVIQQIAGGTASWLPGVKPAPKLETVLDHRSTAQSVGITAQVVIPSYSSDLTTKPAIDVDATASGTASKPAVTPAPAVSTVNSGTADKPAVNTGVFTDTLRSGTASKPAHTPAAQITVRVDSAQAAKPATNPAQALSAVLDNRQTPQNPSAEMVRVKFDLVHRAGGVTATTSGPGWTNAANAQGLKDATLARNTGAALDPAIATLKVNFADLTNKSTLTISQVRLIFYSKLTGTLVTAPPCRFEYSIDNGSTWVVPPLATATADYDDLTNGRAFVLPLLTLAQIQSLEARMTIDFGAVSATQTLDIDAIELEVTATEIWTL